MIKLDGMSQSTDTRLTRRAFTLGSGALMTTTAFLGGCGGTYITQRELPQIPPDEDPIVSALRFGVLAPSAHNTQPWLLELMTPTKARLYTDPDRLLPLTDPPDRQIHISHGTLLEVTAMAATSLGYAAEIEPLPEGDVSKADYGQKPTAEIRLTKKSAPTDPLFEALERRRTSRLAHQGPPLTEAEVHSISAAAQRPGVDAKVVREGLEPYLDLVSRAMGVEVASTEVYEETLAWFRFGREEVLAKGDGLNLQTAGTDSFLARNFLTPGNFLDESNRERFMDMFRDVMSKTQAFFVLTTPNNTMADWLETGRAYVRGQLAAARHDLRFHPVSQPLQEYEAMAPLRDDLAGLLPVAPTGKVQMLVRLGRTEVPAVSPRRELDAMLKKS